MAEKKKKVEKTEDVAENKELCEALAKIEELEKKHLEEQDKYLRVLAEYDNFRKRTVKERDSIYSDAYIDCVKQLLPVIDKTAQFIRLLSVSIYFSNLSPIWLLLLLLSLRSLPVHWYHLFVSIRYHKLFRFSIRNII